MLNHRTLSEGHRRNSEREFIDGANEEHQVQHSVVITAPPRDIYNRGGAETGDGGFFNARGKITLIVIIQYFQEAAIRLPPTSHAAPRRKFHKSLLRCCEGISSVIFWDFNPQLPHNGDISFPPWSASPSPHLPRVSRTVMFFPPRWTLISHLSPSISCHTSPPAPLLHVMNFSRAGRDRPPRPRLISFLRHRPGSRYRSPSETKASQRWLRRTPGDGRRAGQHIMCGSVRTLT